MTEAAKEARRAYHRKWAKENPDKVKAANHAYWERKAAANVQAPRAQTNNQ